MADGLQVQGWKYGQQVDGHDGQTLILAGQIMNTIIFFPKEYRITLAIDLFCYIDVHIFESNLVKNASML